MNPEHPTPTPVNFEAIKASFTDVVMSRGSTDPHARTRAESRLFDVCLANGMDYDEPDHVSWAGGVLTKWWAS